MIRDINPVIQSILGTLFTWFITALGAAVIFLFTQESTSKKAQLLELSLGFAGGVMTAASYWSLLAPAIEMAEESGTYGRNGQWAFVPVSVGFIAGAAFVHYADRLLDHFNITFPGMDSSERDGHLELNGESTNMAEQPSYVLSPTSHNPPTTIHNQDSETRLRIRTPTEGPHQSMASTLQNSFDCTESPSLVTADGSKRTLKPLAEIQFNWRKLFLLVIAVTVHNIPEGLAVGVGFAAIGQSSSATFESARNLALGIAIQNFPEGLAVSLPLRAAGYSMWRSFFYGQLSGMVEPAAGVFGALAVYFVRPLLPYALAFAAGAMIFVVFDDIIPEAHACGSGKLCSISSIVGFVIMMSLDVALS